MRCFGFLKSMMVIFNGVIFLAGAAILGVGIWVKVDSGSILSLLGKLPSAPVQLSQVLNVGYLLIAVGSLLLCIGFLGCCGAIRESQCLLLLFFLIVLLVFISEVAGAIVILVFRPVANQVFNDVGSAAVQSIRSDYGSNVDVTGLWNSTMTTLQCCGFYNASDFVGSPYYKNNNQQFPPQCCQGFTNPCGQADSTVIGCFPKIQQLISSNTMAIVAVALGIAALEICAMVVSMILVCRIRYMKS